ncbi:hypothetical protein E1263_17570 [Kribbella antibiotica]|uniref:Uncharacterized protein n=1 Tax=Kribbella antibiotica TaxID=190195 RepID=A0A4R4ZJ79_9ACTN|nr:hypothetical protein [Kribbella antibiotica]TDD58798.1 hypothetical protein E1263_17570 [Kribbella antibiotica]
MKVLAWLAFPLAATVLAMGWAAWRGRSRGPRRSGGAFAAVEDFRRFSDALAAPGPEATPRRRGFKDRLARSRNTSVTTGTTRPGGSLDSAAGHVGKKLGSAETPDSTKTAGQGS